MANVPFRARARTVDHLGREQIADCPTAISELWKNAYDAYARRAELHIFGGELPVAAVVDDGHGMSEEEFIERWLMLGTDSKAGNDEVPEADRNGLPPRPRQGQKGIGRLSVAYLGPTVLVLSKRASEPFVAALIDWRLFQNPYLTLDDVRIPVETFADRGQIADVVAKLFDGLVDNVWGSGVDVPRQLRLADAWERFKRLERGRGAVPTADAIVGVAVDGQLRNEQLEKWPVWSQQSNHGTAMFIFAPARELSAWVESGAVSDDPEVRGVREKLKFALMGFTNPYQGESSDFRYAAVAHGFQSRTAIVSSEQAFGLDDLRELEHVIEGRFDEHGAFAGRVRAWGKDLGEYKLTPVRLPPVTGVGYVGPFELAFGTYESTQKWSSLSGDVIARLDRLSDEFSGLCVYRDALRVQPYGRPENDFFGMEERRGGHAGREFWAHRRVFGAITLSGHGNPNLRDKAGREGFIDNRAAREFRLLVVELLKQTARRYFGTGSEIRTAETSQTAARYERAKRAEEAAKKRRVSTLRAALRELKGALAEAQAAARELLRTLENTQAVLDVEAAAERLVVLQGERTRLTLPPKPKALSSQDEERYRSYRDQHAELTAQLESAARLWTQRTGAATLRQPEDVARSALGRSQQMLTAAINRWRGEIQQRLEAERQRWTTRAHEDGQRYFPLAAPLLEDLALGRMGLPVVLSELEALREQVYAEISPEYEGYVRALDSLREGIDLDAAVGSAIDERIDLASKVEQWQDLAQLGITVEIVGHELNETASQVSRNLLRLPRSAQETEAFKLANSGFRALVHRLEFLAPLRLSGPRLREQITGAKIEKYIREFFARQLEDRRVELVATPAFRATTITEYPPRVYPVFTNLVNNALYWVTKKEERKILLDRRGDYVFVADTGPGIDPDDESELFNLFFTRRVGGRGVGLFLSRLALAHGRHEIRLADAGERILPGANFMILFRGVSDGN